MIPSEQKFVPIKKHRVPARMARYWNRHEIVIEMDGFLARKDLFNPESLSAVVNVHHALTVEPIRPALMIRDVVFVGEKHPIHSAHRFDLLHQLGGKSR